MKGDPCHWCGKLIKLMTPPQTIISGFAVFFCSGNCQKHYGRIRTIK